MFGSIFNQKKKEDPTAPDQVNQGASATDPQSNAGVQSPATPQQPPEQQQQQSAFYSQPLQDQSAQQPNQPQPADPAQSPAPMSSAPDQLNQQENLPPQSSQTPQAPDQQQPTPTQPESPAPAAGGNPALRADVSSLSHLDPRTTQALTHAQEESKRIKQQYIEPDQLLLGLLYDEQVYKLLGEFQVDGGQLSKEIQAGEKMGTYHGQPILSKNAQQAFDQSYRDAKMRGNNFISPEDLLIVLFGSDYSTAKPLTAKGLKKEAVVEKLSKSPNSTYAHKTVLEKYGIDLTEEARAGRLDPVAGRDKEVDRIILILLRRTKNNPIIIGETGVGKTAIVEGLAQKIVSGQVPKDLQDKRIFQLDVASLIAGASHRGEFEERLRGVINEVLGSNNHIILFIDEIHALMGTGEGEGMNAANIIKPHLARGHFQLIGATTTTEYRKNFEKDKAFERRFQPVTAEEPSEEMAFEMLKVIRPKYEKFHHVTIPDDALKECVKLSKKYIGERFLPDKAIDLLDEAASEVKLQSDSGRRGDTQVKKGDIEKVVSAWTGIPITKLTEDESEKLLKLEDRIHKRLVDQQEAVVSVSEAVRRGRIGLASGQRPIASFIFLGPTGVGKTELAKTLAELLFGRDDAMARLDMSEYMEKHEVAKLIGAPPGYVGYEEGGVLTEAVRKKPYSIVLMDEIEKAHPDVFNILLQLLEDGRLTDNKGNTISFKNTIVICTSNIGSSLIQQQLSTQDPNAKPTAEQLSKQFADLQKIVKEELVKFLRPEILNRFDEVVIFKPLRPEYMAGIVRLEIAKTAKLLKEQGYGLQITEAAVAKLAKDGYDPVYGARPLRRLIQTAIENPIALAIIAKKFSTGDTIVIDYGENTNEFVFSKGGHIQATQPLSDDQFKVLLQKIAQPETITVEADRTIFTGLHERVVKASAGGNKTASAILSVTAATTKEDIQKIRKELEDAKTQGDELAKEILELVDSVAQQIATANEVKRALLEIVDPSLAKTPAKKEKLTQLHEKLQQASQQSALAAAILAFTPATPPETAAQIIDQLKQAKDGGDELAEEVLAMVNSDIAEEVTQQGGQPVTKYKKIFQQLINPLYLAAPENVKKFSALYDKINQANQQNHPIATSILAITDITSDSDIEQLKKQLEQAKTNGDTLASEILDTLEGEIKYEGVTPLKNVLLLIVNPVSASTPQQREHFTQVREKIAQAGEKGNQLAGSLLSVNDATSKDDILHLKEQLEQARDKNDELAKLLLDEAAGIQSEIVAPQGPGQGGQQQNGAPQDPNQQYPFGTGQSAAPAMPPPPPAPPAPNGMAMNVPQGQPVAQPGYYQQQTPPAQQVVEPMSPGLQQPLQNQQYTSGFSGPQVNNFGTGMSNVSSAANLKPDDQT